MTGNVILESRDVGKRFGSFQAVEGVNYRVCEGESVGIIGPNGAGKTTFFNLLTGMFRPSSGSIHYRGQDVSGLSGDRRTALGLVRTFQLVSVFNTLPVIDNLVLAVLRGKPGLVSRCGFLFGRRRPKAVLAACEAALDRVGIDPLVWDQPTANLSYGNKRKLEIAMALALRPAVLLLDEPLAGLSDYEINEVRDLLHQVKRDFTLVIIEHKISRILDLVSRLSVMHEGHLIAEGPVETILADPTVRLVYWGEQQAEPAAANAEGSP
ncbi:MAG: ABC transporter ATP-binding protein [Magnetospirillum sp.]|nr:ABC transporter ATP-binding protein [Magnetospirillum sp.]